MADEKLPMAKATLERPPRAVLQFTVIGIAQPKGSTRAVPIRREVRSLRDIRVTSDNPRIKTWQAAVAVAALCAKAELAPSARDVMVGPVALQVEFFLPRPSGLAKGYVGPHLKKPDLDKLIRGVKDALTDVVWQDDSQVTCIVAGKAYATVGAPARAVITVKPIEPPLFTAQVLASDHMRLVARDQAEDHS